MPNPDEVDEQEAAASGRLRIAGRAAITDEMELRTVYGLSKKIWALDAQVSELEALVGDPGRGRAGAPEDAYLLEKLLLKSLQAQGQAQGQVQAPTQAQT